MQANKSSWVRMNISLPPDVAAKLDKVVADLRRKRPDMRVTRLDVIREYVREGLPS